MLFQNSVYFSKMPLFLKDSAYDDMSGSYLWMYAESDVRGQSILVMLAANFK